MEEKIYKAWKKLYTDYSVILVEAEGIELTRTCLDASRKLQQKDDAS